MKKSIIALMGLFTLVACSEDAYQEVDERVESGSLENNSGGTMMPMTISTGYDSPFQPYGSSDNENITTTFRNNTPLLLELTPFGEEMHAQTFLIANNVYFLPPPRTDYTLNPIPSTSFNVMAGTVETNLDDGAPMAVNAPPYTNSLGSIIYDFGSWTPNWRFYHYGKIYYFKYKIFDNLGNVLKDGVIKHKFYDDADEASTFPASSKWKLVGEVPSLKPMYDVVVMYNEDWDEMCLTNKDGYSANGFDPLPSSVDVVDPNTGTTHVLEFTTDQWGVYVNFN
ncbi:hypothetical protein [Paenimyroides viscosum]|uniref:DUF4249 domain-containing protein n=1 Tax=Paenimyroides viscosum TaxID=2488729 RepID=A0A3P1AW32_9FLAO|nr:hypothetical protein [Paenimyroides viscosum]RRA93299.1 hypothetical protein EG242_10405 [Paenimyroides viscosum]